MGWQQIFGANMAQGMENVAFYFPVSGIPDGQKFLDLFPGRVAGTGTGIRYFRESHPFAKLFNPVFFQEGDWSYDSQTIVKQRLLGEHGAEFSAKKHI